MVYLERVEIRGFKSFSKATHVEFSAGFNVVTGPNGSGKSNIFDAIRFALGENSPKSLRESKMQLLIHNSDQSKVAKVSLLFNNSDSVIPMKEAQVAISRELKPDGTQNYMINGRRATRNNVLDLLAGIRIAYDGLNIVAQGTLTRMVEMGPNEKRQVLEGIVGLKSYDEKKTEALERLRAADNQLEVSFAKLDEKRWSIERLEIERNEFIRYQELYKEVLRYRGASIVHELDEIDAKLIALNQRDVTTQAKLKAKEEEFGGLALFDTTSTISSKFDEMSRAIISEITAKKGELEVLGLRERDIRAKQNEASTRLEESKKLIQSLSAMKPVMEEEVGRSQQTLAKLIEERKALEIQNTNLKDELVHLNFKRLTASKLAERYNARLNKLSSLSRTILNKRVTIENSIRILNIRLDDLTEKVNDLTERSNTSQGFKVTLDNRMNELKQLNSDAAAELVTMMNRLEKVNDLKENLRSHLEGANKVILKSIREVSAADAVDILLKKYGSGLLLNNKELEDLLHAVLDGYIGKLSDLVKAKDGYDKAVMAAIAMYGDPYILKSTADLKKLDEVIGRASLGRVKFIIAGTIPGSPEKTPNSICEVMKYNDDISTLVTSLFGKICLAPDDASALNSLNVTFITKDGKVYGNGFFETGNFIQNQIYNEIDSEKVNRVNTAITNLTKMIEKKEVMLGELLKRHRQISKEVNVKRLKIDVDSREIAILEEYLRKSESTLLLISKNLERSRNSIKGYQKRIDRLKGYMEKLNIRNQILKEKYEVLQSKLRENSLTELDRLVAEKNDALVNVSNRVIQVNDSISTLQAQLTGESEPKLKQVKEAISKSLKQIGDDEAFLDSSQKELLEISAAIDGNRVKLAELETRLGEVRGLVEKDEGQGRLEEQRRLKLMGEIGSLKNEITKIGAEKEKIGIRRNELKDQLNGMGVTPYEFEENTSVMLGLLEAELNELSSRLNRIAERDYREMYTSYRDASIRRGELEKDRDAIVKFINEIDSQKRAVFIKAYEEIDKEFRVIFRKITSGEAWLELESIDDPFSGGLFIMGSFGNTPARESASLSGGEKSVISVAFLMALQSSYPSPFYLFDEIDANMDARYTNSLGNLLREWGQKSQLIVVTLRDLVASKANNVIGVYRKDGDSSVARLNMEEVNNVI